MKNRFAGYFPLPEEAKKEIWEKAVFVIDTSSLLDLYRLSIKTRNEWLKMMEKVKDRLWMPHQVGQEYMRNRPSVIASEEKKFEEQEKLIKRTLDDENTFTPFQRYAPEKVKEWKVAYASIKPGILKDLEALKKEHPDLKKDDTILKTLTDIFDGKVGIGFTDDKLSLVEEEAKRRIQKKIPPGFADDEKTGIFQYGDYFIWKQIMDEISKRKVPCIFITSDLKEDWWLIERGEKIGPRPELVEEFHNKTSQKLLFVTPKRFFEYCNTIIKDKKQQVSPESLQEIVSLSNQQLALQAKVAAEALKATLNFQLGEAFRSQLYQNSNEILKGLAASQNYTSGLTLPNQLTTIPETIFPKYYHPHLFSSWESIGLENIQNPKVPAIITNADNDKVKK